MTFALLMSFSFVKLSMATDELFERPVREFSIIATEEGYYPESIFAFVGEKVRIFVTSTMDRPTCFIVPHRKFYLAAHKGKIAEGDYIFRSPGEYPYYCPGEKFKGTITILSKSGGVEEKPSSEEKNLFSAKAWRPKNK